MKKTRKLLSVMTSMALFTCAAVVPMSTDAGLVTDNVRSELESTAGKIRVNVHFRYESDYYLKVRYETMKQAEEYASEQMAEYLAGKDVSGYTADKQTELMLMKNHWYLEAEHRLWAENLRNSRIEQVKRIFREIGVDISEDELTDDVLQDCSLYCLMDAEQIAKAEASEDIALVAVDEDLDPSGHYIGTPDKNGSYTYLVRYSFDRSDIEQEAINQTKEYIANELTGKNLSETEKSTLENQYYEKVKNEMLSKAFAEKSAYIIDTCDIDRDKTVINPFASSFQCVLSYEQLQKVKSCELVKYIELNKSGEFFEFTTSTTCIPDGPGGWPTTASSTTAVTTTEYYAIEYYGNAAFTDIIEKIDANGVTFQNNGYFRFSWQSIADRFSAYKAGDEIILSCYYMRLFKGDTPNIQNIFMLSRSKLDLGDPTGDSKIDARDASFALAEYSLLSTGGASTLTTVEKTAADANKDGQIDSKDASLMLSMYAYNATSEKNIETMTEYIEYQRG